MRRTTLIMLTVAAALLAACSGAQPATDATDPIANSGPGLEQSTQSDSGAAAPVVERNTVTAATPAALPADIVPVDALSADYADALPVDAQLALGTVQLDDTPYAVTVEQAATLLPLWQALQALVASGTAAQVELDAVVNQLQAAMTAEQLGAIAAMALTADSVTDLFTGGLGLGAGNGEGGGFFFGGSGGGQGGPPGDFAIVVGPGGGGPGGGAGGGLGPGGGAGGALGGEIDPATLATRQAERAESLESGDFISQMSASLVIRALEIKTGDLDALAGIGLRAAVEAVAEALGLEQQALFEQLAAGQTLQQIIESGGGDLSAAREAIIAALNSSEQFAAADTVALAERLLGETFEGGPGFGNRQGQQEP